MDKQFSTKKNTKKFIDECIGKPKNGVIVVNGWHYFYSIIKNPFGEKKGYVVRLTQELSYMTELNIKGLADFANKYNISLIFWCPKKNTMVCDICNKET